MPDLKTALASVINQWEKATPVAEPKPEPAMLTNSEPPKTISRFPITSNTSRATFETLKDNPGKTRKEIVHILQLKGFGAQSTASLLSRMAIQGVAREDSEGRMYAATNTYQPLKSGTALKKLRDKNLLKSGYVPVRRGRPKGIKNSVKAVTAPVIVSTPTPTPAAKFELTADYIIKNIGLAEAKRLHDELGHFFK